MKAKPAEAASAGGGGEKRNKTDDAKTDQPAAQPGAEAAPEVDNNAMPVPKVSVDDSAANQLIGEFVQSRRRPLLGPLLV